ncbi:penicillin-binding protein [Bacillus salitolerans]|uniref:serine-type D-Ala-D-Ala carboxypeptidase n=1 Tax=Bacillus salitolerans TaxID=1437434 RepID=A0ABW4LKI1_9BACI
MHVKNKNINKGAAFFSIVFGLLFFLLFARFLFIQVTGVVDGQELPVLAEQKYSKSKIIEASRGSILDRNGIPIAQDTPAYTVIAILDESKTKNISEPNHVVDPAQTASKLSPIINMSVERLQELLTRDKDQVELGPGGRGISYKQMKEIQDMELPGITFIRDTKRYYPNGKFATHVIGFAQKDESGKVIGRQGLESTLDELLQEEDGVMNYKSDGYGIKLPFQNEEIIPPQNGQNVFLTIDHKIQAFLEDAMNRVETDYSPENIIGIVADPKTGAILAMSSRPSYDPNNIPPDSYMLNDAISLRFEPGSTMKIFTLAAAIEEGVFDPNEEYQSGSYTVGPNRVRDHNNGQGWGKITYLEGFQRSSNVAMAKLVNEKMNADDRLLNYLQAFGFNQPTGIDLPGEVNGKLLYRYPIEKVTTAFGQGTSVTPIQQIQAATAIVNGGKMLRPYIVNKIVDPVTNEIIKEQKPEIVGTPISEQTAKQVMDILESAVSSENGTGKPYRIEGYQVAGKTGTAQIPDPVDGYMRGHGNNIFSFLGFAPKDDPKLLVYIAVKKPKLTIHQSGSQPVSAIFNSVVKNSLHYLNIKPTTISDEKEAKVEKSRGIELDSVVGKQADRVAEELKSKGIDVFVLGSGEEIFEQIPFPSSVMMPGEKVLLRTEGPYLAPNLSGWSLRDVLKLTEILDLKPNFMGNGFVHKQNISPESPIKQGDYLVIEFIEPNPTINRYKEGESDLEDTKDDEGMEVESATEVEKPLD